MNGDPAGVGMRFGFPSPLRLKSSQDFLQARQFGRKIHTSHFIRYGLVKSDGPSRLGITVSRKVGGSVARNRVKRLVREYFRLHQEQLPMATDFSIIAKRGAAELGFSQVIAEMKILFGA